MTAVNGANRLTQYGVTDREITYVRTSRKLDFELTGLGYLSTVEREDGAKIFRAVGTTTTGVPRELTVTERSDSTFLPVRSATYAQKNFEPRLFTDAYYFYAYTINDAGVLKRWTNTRLAGGGLAYRSPVTLAKNLKDVTALTTAAYRRNPLSDLLYLTTAAGALKLVKVPFATPGKRTFKTLATTGYAGVTELSSGYCNGDDRGVVAAIDPVAGTATWTVVTKLRTVAQAKAVPKGKIQGDIPWALHAVM